MSQVIVFPDAVQTALTYLRSEQSGYAALNGYTFGAKIPGSSSPIGKAILLRRVGGTPSTFVTDAARIAVTAWGPDDFGAMAALLTVRALLAAAPGAVISGVTITRYQEFAGPGLRPDPVDTARDTPSFTAALSLRGYPAGYVPPGGGGGGGGGGGSTVASFEFTQTIPNATWTVIHNLGRHPQVTVAIGGAQVEADVIYVDLNTVQILFADPQMGDAYLI